MNGILPLWKPKGLTSHDCIYKIRRIFGTKKVGHTGTLDPEAEGVLTICIGEATKLVPYLMDTDKTYIAEMTLGSTTETEDHTGAVVETKEVACAPSRPEVERKLNFFKDEIVQTPPMYSAVKVEGKKLYEYARQGKYVERPERTVSIYELDLLQNEKEKEGSYSFFVRCSKGTYIRTLCVDIGASLGYPAHMSDLVRIETSGYHKNQAYSFEKLEKLKNKERLSETLSPLISGVHNLKKITISSTLRERVLCGQKLSNKYGIIKDELVAFINEGELIAIYKPIAERTTVLKAVRVFYAK